MEKGRKFVVVGIRHFTNEEHHWFAPDYADDVASFGAVGENAYYKPLFGKVDDAAKWAMSMKNGEWGLAKWESQRPTFLVIPDDAYSAIVEREPYPLPKDAEEWSDAKMADFARERDCEEFVKAALWDSDTAVAYYDVMEKLNALDEVAASVDDGLLCVEYLGNRSEELVADDIVQLKDFPAELEWVKSDESASVAWFK